MEKTKDTLYAIFMGLLLYLSGTAIIGGASYLIDVYLNGFDFITLILYFIFCKFFAFQIMKGVHRSSTFITVILCIYAVFMYLLKDYVVSIVETLVAGGSIINALKGISLGILISFLYPLISLFSIGGLFNNLTMIFYVVIELLVIFCGVYDTYKVANSKY